MVFVFMTPCCDLGQLGGVLRQTTADNNSEKPFATSAQIAPPRGNSLALLLARRGPEQSAFPGLQGRL